MVSRLDTMSRFAEPNDTEPKVLEICTYCGEQLVEGQEVIKMETEFFCDDNCCHLYHEIESITLGE